MSAALRGNIQYLRLAQRAIVALASASTTRKRVYKRFAQDTSDISAVSKHVASLQTAAYEQRLAQLAKQMGVTTPVGLKDAARLKAIARDAKDVGYSVVHTHNTDLRNFVNKQPKSLSQRELASRVKEWADNRKAYKPKQIAQTEGMKARNLADQDIIAHNSFEVQQRVAPSTAAEARCALKIGLGWLKPGDIDFSLPLHVGCVHGWEYKQDLAKLAQQRTEAGKQLWTGG